jgi:hypothetical protein
VCLPFKLEGPVSVSVLNRLELKTNFFTAAGWKINSFEEETQEAMNKTQP